MISALLLDKIPMGLFERFTKPKTVAIEQEETPVSFEELLRLSEQDETVATILEQFESRVVEVRQQATIGGGMTPADWNIIQTNAQSTAEQLQGQGVTIAAQTLVESV